MPEVDSGSGIVLLVMGIVYSAGFLLAAWFLVRRISRKDSQFYDQDPSAVREEEVEDSVDE